jgi:DNA-binding NtrC family response regulator
MVRRVRGFAAASPGSKAMKTHWQILVVDDEEVMCESLAAWLREDGYHVDTASSGREALEKAGQRDYAIYFVDLKMPGGMDGIETMMQIRRLHAEASIIIITAYATVDTAITAMKEGAQEYIVKPCNPEEISLLVNRIIKVKNLQRENTILRKKLSRHYRVNDVISKNPRMQEILSLAHEVSSLRSTVLIQGESGTGKEMVARAVHYSGDRASKPFVAVSCAALAETLLESELFGHEKGAFTGAGQQKQGKFEMADGGTIFLDEIGDISPKLQVDLLRVLQDRSFYRVGGSEEVKVDVRVIAATHVNLQQAVAAGKFREDLFYRLNVIEIRIPPLRDRREDIPLLAEHFVEKLSHELGRDVGRITEGGLKTLMAHDWPGNVRELENAIERAIVTCRTNSLTEEDFQFLAINAPGPKTVPIPAGMTIQEMEKLLIMETLRRTGGNIKESASVLGIDRSTMYEKIKKYEIPR